MRTLAAAAAAAALALAAAGPGLAQTAGAQPSTPLIERAKLFGNPAKRTARISPDGKWLAWVAPHNGVQNVWAAPVGDMAKGKPLTNETVRPVAAVLWAPDSSRVLYTNDEGGDENFRLFGVAPTGGAVKALTPKGARVEIVQISRKVKDRILVGLNDRDPKWHDVHSLNLTTGELTLVQRNEGYAGFVADQDLRLRMALRSAADGSIDVFTMQDGKIPATPTEKVEFEDVAATTPLGFDRAGTTLYLADSRGRDRAAIVARDFATGRNTVVAEDAKADVETGLFDPKTGRIQAFQANYLRAEWKPVDDAVAGDLERLKRELKGDINITSRTDDDRLWTVAVNDPISVASVHLYDRQAGSLTKLYDTYPDLVGAPLVAMHPREIKSRDGMTLVSYLSLPPGSDTDGDGVPEKPVPLVLNVHGGPRARDEFGYNPEHQWLANRGYAVLSVNYRASTGFGKAFVNAGNAQWGAKMHDDLLDAADWAAKQGITTPEKTAIYGGSYGGYATLAGLAFTPDRFACGVDIVGPSNLVTLLNSIPPYWESFRTQLIRSVGGDPATAEGQAFLKSRSPLTKADAIRKPLLIAQGANDPRVKQAESDQIVAAMQAKNIPVTYVLFPDEGHGFARPENNIAFYAVSEDFLARCLGGRAEPYGAALNPSTLQVKAGEDVVPGLKAALAARPAAPGGR